MKERKGQKHIEKNHKNLASEEIWRRRPIGAIHACRTLKIQNIPYRVQSLAKSKKESKKRKKKHKIFRTFSSRTRLSNDNVKVDNFCGDSLKENGVGRR